MGGVCVLYCDYISGKAAIEVFAKINLSIIKISRLHEQLHLQKSLSACSVMLTPLIPRLLPAQYLIAGRCKTPLNNRAIVYLPPCVYSVQATSKTKIMTATCWCQMWAVIWLAEISSCLMIIKDSHITILCVISGRQLWLWHKRENKASSVKAMKLFFRYENKNKLLSPWHLWPWLEEEVYLSFISVNTNT